MLALPRHSLLILAGLAGLTACGGDAVGAGDVLVVAAVDITPPTLELVTGSGGQLQASPKTSSGIAVPNRKVDWSSDNLGIATVSSTGMVTAVASGATRINATVDGVRGGIAVTIMPKPVASVTVVPDQVTILVGESTDLTATPRDAAGQPLAGRAVTFSSDNPLIATVSTFGHVTAVGPGLTVVRANVEGKTGSANVSVNERPASQLDFQTEPGTGAAGVPLQPIRIAVQNDQGGTVTIGAIPVTLALADNPTGAVLSGTITVSAVNGVATFTDLRLDQAGTGYTLRATSGSLKPADSAPFAIVAGPAAALGISVQPSSSASSGAPLVRQPVVRVYDANGNPVAKAGVQVIAALDGAGATLDGTRAVTTNAEGVANFTNLALFGSPGTYTLLFAASGLTAVASSGITLAGAATTLTLTQQPAATALSGVVLSRQPVVQLRDAQGNPVAQVGTAVSASINTGGGALNGSLTVLTDTNGRATFANLSIGGAAGTYTLRFSAVSLASVVSENVVVQPGNAAALAIATSPPPATSSGDVLSPAPVVRVVDAFGSPVDPEAEFPVTVTIGSGNGGSLSGTTTVTTSSGVAAFSGLILTGPTGTYTLQFSGGGLTPAVSGTIVIGAGAPTTLVIVTQPSSTAESGTAFAQQPVIQVRDALGNPVPQSGIVVTAAIATGGGTLSGTMARATNANGQAVFTDLAIKGTPGPRTLQFTSSGLSGATSSTIDLTAPPPSSLQLTTQPSATAKTGVALAQQPVVRVTDKFGDPVSGITITAVLNSGPAGASLAGATAQSDTNGLARFSGVAITGLPGDYTLRFGTGNLSVISGTITILPEPAKLLLTTPPSATAASGIPLTTPPVVQIADKDGAPVALAGTTVTAVIASGPSGASLASATVVSDGSGAATFSGLTISGVVGSYTLRFQSGTLTPVTSGAVALGPGNPATLTIPTQPPSKPQNDEPFADAVVVRVQDGAGNNIPGVTVTAALASGSGVLKGDLSQVTESNGRASFDGLSIVGLVGSYTIVFAAPNGASVVSRTINLSAGHEVALAIQVQPSSSATGGVNFAAQPRVDLRDSGGNLVARDGVRVNASLETVSGSGALFGDASKDTNNGVATYTDLRIGGSGTFRLRFTTSGLTSVTSVTILVTQQ